jgi:hypothetical protein
VLYIVINLEVIGSAPVNLEVIGSAPGTNVMILKINIFARWFGEKIAFFYSNYCKLLLHLIIILVFERKTPIFSQKIVIITSTPFYP